MGAESGCLVFSSSRGDDAWCYCSLNACILPLHGFFFAQSCFCSGFFFLPGVTRRTWPHSIFGISISSHVALRYIQHNYSRHFHVSFIRFYRITQYTFLFAGARFIACTKLDIGPSSAKPGHHLTFTRASKKKKIISVGFLSI